MTHIAFDMLMEYAGMRLGEGDHLAEIMLKEMRGGKAPLVIREEAVECQSYLAAYLADCLYRLQGGAP